MSGLPIPDYSTRCKRSSTAPLRDLAYEVEQLFPVTAARPTTRLRELLHRRSVSQQRAAWARKTIIAMLRKPLAALFDMADALADHILKNVSQRTDQRVHAALTRVLMYLSDCWRYTLDHAAAKNAAQMLQIVNPGDPQAHLRLAMNLAMLGDGNDAIRPFFHYCVFLTNRKVDAGHSEAVVVDNFVKSRGRATGDEEYGRRACFAALIDTLWSVLSDDFQEAAGKVRRLQLWDSFEQCAQDGFSAGEMMDTVGAVIFAHHRCSPKGSPGGKLLPQYELADYLIARLIHIACTNIVRALQALHTELQKRKKNRRRAMQKKRRADSSVADRDTAIGFEIFTEKVDLDNVTPALGAISLMAHYWSKARSAPSPSVDLKPLGRTLKALQDVKAELEKIEKLTCTGPLASHIESKILAGVGGRIPAMPEDLKFCHFLPCQEYNMFHQTALQEVPLPSILKRTEEGIVRPALKTMGDQTYESLVATTARRHLEAFSLLATKEAAMSESAPKLEKQAACNLVCMTVRKCRLRRLVRDLEKVGGGNLMRMSLESSCDPDRDEALVNDQEHEVLPSPGQPRPSISEHEDSFHEPISPGELGAQVRKRRRLLGTCTAPVVQSIIPGSQSNPSSVDRPSHHDRFIQELPRSQAKDATATPSPKVGQKRIREQRRTLTASIHRTRHGGFLSQGSLQLSYAQPAQPRAHQTSSQRQPTKRCSELYTILRNVLYPPDAGALSTPSDMEGPAFWRNPPSDDLQQNIFQSQSLSSDG